MPEPAPLILSAVLDAPVQRRLDALRRTHFPPDRNHLDAHVTLFHHLPGAEEDAVAEEVDEAVGMSGAAGRSERRTAGVARVVAGSAVLVRLAQGRVPG